MKVNGFCPLLHVMNVVFCDGTANWTSPQLLLQFVLQKVHIKKEANKCSILPAVNENSEGEGKKKIELIEYLSIAVSKLYLVFPWNTKWMQNTATLFFNSVSSLRENTHYKLKEGMALFQSKSKWAGWSFGMKYKNNFQPKPSVVHKTEQNAPLSRLSFCKEKHWQCTDLLETNTFDR